MKKNENLKKKENCIRKTFPHNFLQLFNKINYFFHNLWNFAKEEVLNNKPN